MKISFHEAEFLKLLLDKQIEVFSKIEQPGMIDNLLAINSFMGGEDEGELTEQELSEDDPSVIESFKILIKDMRSLRNKIKDHYGI